MKIFVCNLFKTYTVASTVRAMKRMGISVVEKTYYTPEDLYQDEALQAMVEKDVAAAGVDAVFTVNYWPVVARACKSLGMKYLAWSYDSPQNLPTTETMEYETNYIFLFDREEVRRYREKGLTNVYHLLLAVDSEHLQEILGGQVEYQYDVSFVGSMYQSDLSALMSQMSAYERGYLQAVMAAQEKIYGYYMVDDLLTESHLDAINEEYRVRTLEAAKSTGMEIPENQILKVSMEQLSYAIATQVTHIDRLSLLHMLSKNRKVAVWTDEKQLTDSDRELLANAKIMGWADYDTEMPQIFAKSKINLNPSLRIIRSGIPLRALDIMGAGGFLLSSFQAELMEHFQNGKECVMYNGLEDAISKVQYYILHKDEREAIAKAGCEKVRREFRYEDRIGEMMRIAGLEM